MVRMNVRFENPLHGITPRFYVGAYGVGTLEVQRRPVRLEIHNTIDDRTLLGSRISDDVANSVRPRIEESLNLGLMRDELIMVFVHTVVLFIPGHLRK